jgi:glutamate-1-semialdehyde 2,1-aminomutase
MEHVAPLGKMYQAGTLSGNPLAMAAGIAALTTWREPGNFERAAAAAERLLSGMKQIADAAGIPLQARSIGTMFGFFFNPAAVTDYDSAKKSDVVLYRRVFHALLERGVYFAPSQFEAGFISSAHDDAAIDETLAAWRDALAAVGQG